jgi:hypothetical protein
MGIAIAWDNAEKTIVRFVYEGKWTWEDFYQTIARANEMMDTVNKPVVSIIDMQKSNFLPYGAAIHIRNVIRQSQSHNNSGISVFLQADVIVKAMIEVLRKSYPDILANTAWIYAKTLEEAQMLAQEQVNKLHGKAADV